MGDVELMMKQAKLWRLLYSPTSSIFIYKEFSLTIGVGDLKVLFPADVNRILFGVATDADIYLKFNFNRDITPPVISSPGGVVVFKVEDYGSIVQDEVKVQGSGVTHIAGYTISFRL